MTDRRYDGFTERARRDEGARQGADEAGARPTAFGSTELTAGDEATIAELVRKAVS
jgi:hypothetical protein